MPSRLWPGIWDPSPLLSASFPRVSQISPLRQANSVSSCHPKGQGQGPGPTTHPSHLHITVWTALPHDSEPCTVRTPQTRQPMPLAFPLPPNRLLCMWKPVVHGQCKQHLTQFHPAPECQSPRALPCGDLTYLSLPLLHCTGCPMSTQNPPVSSLKASYTALPPILPHPLV